MFTLMTLAASDFWDSNQAIALCGLASGVAIVIVIAVTKTVRDTARDKELEQSRREIAAYVAEGSMTPDEGERLLSAGRSSVNTRACCTKNG